MTVLSKNYINLWHDLSRVDEHLSTLFSSFQDLHLVELEDFKYGGTNITGYRLVDPTQDWIVDIVEEWVKELERLRGPIMGPERNSIQV